MSSFSSVVFSAVTSCSFGFYSDEDIKRLSVKRITRSDGLDSLGQPIPGGLYDAALGPIDRMASCKTCKLPFERCPGHVGHIELAVPVYHPLLFNFLMRLLRVKCLHCHRFRFPHRSLNMLARKIQLIENGLVLEAFQIDSSSSRKLAGISIYDEEDMSQDDEFMEDGEERERPSELNVLDGILQRAKHEKASSNDMRAFRRITIKDFFRWAPPKLCSHCKLPSPNLRSEGCQKIFIQGGGRRSAASKTPLRGILDEDVRYLFLFCL
jgi:DNA-directed RNA polymerase I subunit RPA1